MNVKRSLLTTAAALLATSAYAFPPVDSLPDNPLMPDPFRKPDGTRVASLAEWPPQRAYLKALLQHYLYGHLPPKPTAGELSFTRLSDEAYSPPGSEIKGRKQGYRITIARNGLTHSFSFNAAPMSDTWRYDPAKYPLLIDWPDHSNTPFEKGTQ